MDREGMTNSRKPNWEPSCNRIIFFLLITFLCFAVMYIAFFERHSFWHLSTDYNQHRAKTCNPKSNLVFSRVHKCGSSTVQNILLRYGDKHNLIFVLPRRGIYFGHPQPFDRQMIPATIDPEQKFNMLVHHMRLDYKEVRLLMPSNSAFITILRDPVSLFESMYQYCNLSKLYHTNLNEFVEFADTEKMPFYELRIPGKRMGINQIAFDLGMDSSDFARPLVIRRYAKVLDDYFDLVMILERFEESLILLKDLMCWDIEDVIAFQLNKRSNVVRTTFTKQQSEKVRKINGADQIIYSYFRDRFEQKVRAFGEDRMRNEVTQLKTLTREMFLYCVKGELKNGKVFKAGKMYNFSKPVQRYNVVDDTMCVNMAENEAILTDYLRRKQKDIY